MSKISSHLEANNLICENQHSFQRGKSCETQLIHTIDDIATDLDNGREIDALFLDFSKAFDKFLIKTAAQIVSVWYPQTTIGPD